METNGLWRWYKRPNGGSSRSPSESLMQQAFQEAKAKFTADQTSFIASACSLKDVQQAVSMSMEKYTQRREESKARKWLGKLAERIHFYSSVVDVFAQHHPEYIALVWGSLKFLLVAVVNHEKIVACLAKAIYRIASNLPTIELASILYPTDQMRETLIALFASILVFLGRAKDWYERGKVWHIVHSITSPVELKYDDLLANISEHSRVLDRLCVSGQQVETRETHNKVTGLEAGVKGINDMATDLRSGIGEIKGHAIQQQIDASEIQIGIAGLQASMKEVSCRSVGQEAEVKKIRNMVQKLGTAISLLSIDTNAGISDIQFGQIMASLPNGPGSDPMKAFQYHCSLKRQRTHLASTRSVSSSFWRSPKLRQLSSTERSSLSVAVGNSHSRFFMRNMCVDIIEQLLEANIPVLIAMPGDPESGQSTHMTTSDIFKSLVQQAMRIRSKAETERSMSVKCSGYYGSSTEKECFQLLEAVIADMKGTVYIVLDLALLDVTLSPIGELSWISAFEGLFKKIEDRGLSTKVKILMVSYGPLPFQLSDTDRSKFVIQATTRFVTARQRKAKRGPKSSQVPFRMTLSKKK